MSMLFISRSIGTLQLPNRLVRSATAERMADDNGRPRPELQALYQRLVRGGVGLIITGHMYVHPSGRAHREMTGIYADALVPALAELAHAAHAALPLFWRARRGADQSRRDAVQPRLCAWHYGTVYDGIRAAQAASTRNDRARDSDDHRCLCPGSAPCPRSWL